MAHAELRIEVVYCPAPAQAERVMLRLPEGACLHDALRGSGMCERHGLDADTVLVGIWGRVQPGHALLRDHDRVEIYRPLKVDPKEARRLRYKGARQRQGG